MEWKRFMKINREDFKDYIDAFLIENSKVNLISKNDEKFLWEKHIFDSLAIGKFFEKYEKGKTMLDIGTGGGFPAVPVALVYPDLQVCALDSIRKKINAIENLKLKLDIKNLTTICGRAENIKGSYDIITSRAVAPLSVITKYAAPLLAKKGYFIAYKSRKTDDEIKDALPVLKQFSLNVAEVIEYELPLEDNFTRNLIIIH